VPPHEIARRGIARTFQNIELFEHASVLQNLLLGRHAHRRSGFVEELLFLPRVRTLEVEHRAAVEKSSTSGPAAAPRQPGRQPLVRGPQGHRDGARALHPTEAPAPRRAVVRLSVEETEGMAFWIQDIRTALGITV